MEKIDNIILKYLYKTTSPDEDTFLLQWLEESEDNSRYFRSLKDAHDLGQLEYNLQNSQVNQQWNKFGKRISQKEGKSSTSRYLITFMRYAAVFILGFVCFQTIIYFTKKEEEKVVEKTIVETGVGERSKITLPDGSQIWINACSSLVYDNTYGEQDRRVHLKGEGYFEVNTDTVKPFFVHADQFTYRVTGTSFNVYSFDNENEVSIALLEGGVTIQFADVAEHLLPGQVFTFDKTSSDYKRTLIDVNRLSSWRNGELIFENMTFDELARRLERSFNVRFIFENDKVRKNSFGGSFRNYESLETILKVISASTPVRYEIRENIVYIK